MSETTQPKLTNREYQYGFVTDVESVEFPAGLDEDVIRRLSAIKGEPAFVLEFRLKAYRHWLTMTEPTWAHVTYPPVDFQAIRYYSAPKKRGAEFGSPKTLDDVDAEVIETFKRLGIPLS